MFWNELISHFKEIVGFFLVVDYCSWWVIVFMSHGLFQDVPVFLLMFSSSHLRFFIFIFLLFDCFLFRMFMLLPLSSLRRTFWWILTCRTFLSSFSDWSWTKASSLLQFLFVFLNRRKIFQSLGISNRVQSMVSMWVARTYTCNHSYSNIVSSFLKWISKDHCKFSRSERNVNFLSSSCCV